MANRNQTSVSNGVTEVIVLASPSASTTRTIGAGWINITNLDTASIVVTLQLADGAVNTVLESAITIAVGDSWSNDKNVYTLDANTQQLEVFLAGAVATTEADIMVSYRDEVQ